MIRRDSLTDTSYMNGQITKFRKDLGVGVIIAEDGQRYRFSEEQVMNAAQQIAGANVDFLLVDRRPAEIIVMAGSPWTVFGDLVEIAQSDSGV